MPSYSNATPCSIHVPLLKDETADHDVKTWPPTVARIMARELDMWAHRNPDFDIADQTFYIDPVRRVCVCEFTPSQATVPA